MKHARKKGRGIVWVLVSLLLLAGIAAVVFWQWQEKMMPSREQSAVPENGVLILTELDEKTFRLEWPQGTDTDFYLVEVLDENGLVLRSNSVVSETTCVLQGLDRKRVLTLRVQPAQYDTRSGSNGYRLGRNSLSFTGILTPPRIQEVARVTDPDADTVQIFLALESGDICRLFQRTADGTLRQLQTLEDTELTLTFGEGGAYPLPNVGEPWEFCFRVCREQPGLRFYSQVGSGVTVTREELRDTQLRLETSLGEDNVCVFHWNETRGQSYQLQMQEKGQTEWITLYSGTQQDPLEYTTQRLKSFWDYRFRIMALEEDGTQAVSPVEIEFHTDPSPIYTTIWALKSLPVYGQPDAQSPRLGETLPGEAFCVLALENGFFRVRFGKQQGYVDSNYCMINLPEYLGTLCAYEIVNSHSSLYKIHDLEIPTVTGTVIAGYEQVRTAEGEYLVPLLYPAALKLKEAALDAYSQGYRLKIYDSFRPWKATRAIYEQTSALLQTPIPEEQLALLTPEEQAHYFPEGVPQPGAQPELGAEPPVLTYQQLMTDNDRYALGNFLAPEVSNHNRGIALDLTLERLDSGEELPAQTAIHDLSWYSEPLQNKENANLLQSIMTGAGMVGLNSEWWHFQDNDAKYGLELDPLWEGISPACWMADTAGWRYRRADGSYCVDCTEQIGGIEYTFDSDGLVITS